jgi:hypothetical protein
MTSYKTPNESIKLQDSAAKHLLPLKETIVQVSRDRSENSNRTFTKPNEYLRKKTSLFGILSIIVLLIILIGLACYILLETKKKIRLLENVENLENRCRSNSCYQMSNFMLDNLNQTVEPCTNFYDFSCGSWEVNSNGLEKDQFTQAYEKMLLFFSEILKNPIDKSFSKLKVIFCFIYKL